MSGSSDDKAPSTELTGGAGFTYEDTVGAYYLAQLLRRGRAAGQTGVVTSVAVQQQGHGNPMDDLIVEFNDVGTRRVLGLQIKKSVTISGAASNEEFSGIITAATQTQASGTFTKDADKCGFVVDHVTPDTLRTLQRLIDWAVASPDGAHFEARFAPSGAAAQPERDLRDALKPVIGAANADDEVDFYKNFVAFRFDGLEEGGVLRTEVINGLQELIAVNEDGQDLLLFDRLCRIAREGSAKGAKWTRASLVAQLRSAVRLKISPHLGDNISRLNAYSLEALNVVSKMVDDFHVERAKRTTSTIPIVFAAAGDAVETGLVDGLAHPGGNVTGLSIENPDLAGKQIELLREVVPNLRYLGVLTVAENPVAASVNRQLKAAARTIGIDVDVFETKRAEDITSDFDLFKNRDALYVFNDPLMATNRIQINTLALSARLPTIYAQRDYVEAGALMSYGPDFQNLWRRAAEYVDKILRGTKPADIPVEQPTKFNLVINLTTAKALGIKVPGTLLARANEVIE